MISIDRFDRPAIRLPDPAKHKDHYEAVESSDIPTTEAGTSSAIGITKQQSHTQKTQEINPEDQIELAEEDLSFPDGGTEAYLVVLVALLSLIITFGLMNTIGAIQAYLTTHQLANASASSVGWIFSVYFFFAFGGGIYAGPIFDFKGARLPMVTGSVLVILGLFLTANCKKVYQFVLAYGVIVGVGTSFLMSASLGAVAHWFNKKRATALGMCSMGGSLGGVIWPLMLRSLYPKIGYAWTMRVLAFCSIVCLGLGCLLVKHRLQRTSGEIKSPKQIIKDSFVLKDLLHEKNFLTLTISVFLCEFSLILVITYLSSYTIYQGYTESDAFLVLIVCNSTGVLGRYLPNYMGDHWGRMNIMFVTVLVCSILILVVWLPFGHSLATLYAFAGLYGFFSSSTLSLTPVCCGQISRTEDFGKRYGTVYFLVSFGNLIALPIGGAIIGDGSGYNNLIITAGVFEVVAAAFWLLTRYYCVGMRLCKV